MTGTHAATAVSTSRNDIEIPRADVHGNGARWREVKLDQRSLPMLRPAALISCSRIANLETCWNGRTPTARSEEMTKAGAER